MMNVPGSLGYGAQAAKLAEEYERLRFEDVHEPWLYLLPAPPAMIADIGAGTGRDAAALTRLGHHVVAVEPTLELRRHARRAHHDADIEWLNDALPDLPLLDERHFDLILLSAVWMHLAPDERDRAMARLASLTDLIVLTLRHGPPPQGRHMFDVTVEETVALATGQGLSVIHRSHTHDRLNRPEVTWSYVALHT